MEYKTDLEAEDRVFNQWSRNQSIELKPPESERLPPPTQRESMEESAAFDLVPVPALPDNFPTPRSEQIFRLLWQRIWTVQRYRDYRYGHSMSQKAKKDRNKWPFQSEEAFWRACASIPPRHRRKEPYPGRTKTLGRNEAIAAYINDILELTPNPEGGKKPWPEWDETPDELQELTRKNISSHLQVLRPWFRDTDQFVFGWISGDHGESSPSRANRSPVNRNQRRNASLPSSYSSAGLPNQIESFKTSRMQSIDASTSFSVPRSRSESRVATSIDCFKFRMFFQQCRQRYSSSHVCGSLSNCNFDILHTFTKTMMCKGMPDTEVAEADFYRRFPMLISANPIKHQHARLVFAEASLALPCHNYSMDGSVDLGIDGRFATNYALNPLSVWYCRTTFYEAGKAQAEHEQRLEKINELSDQNVFCHYLPFASRFWVAKLSDLIHQLRRARMLENENHTEGQQIGNGSLEHQVGCVRQLKEIKGLQDVVGKGIDQLSARQEVLEYQVSQYNEHDSPPVTHLTIVWKFRHTQTGEEGLTQFRNISIQTTKNSPSMSRQGSPADTFGFQDYQQGNIGATSHKYHGNHGSTTFGPTVHIDGNFTSSYDFQVTAPYQDMPEERPCSSLSTVQTVTSTSSSISTGIDDFHEYQDRMVSRPFPDNSFLGVGSPPAVLISDQVIQQIDTVHGTGNHGFGDMQMSSLSQSPQDFENLDKAYSSTACPKTDFSQAFSLYNSYSATSIPSAVSNNDQQHFSHYGHNQSQQYRNTSYARRCEINSDKMDCDSQHLPQFSQLKEFDDRFLSHQHFTFE